MTRLTGWAATLAAAALFLAPGAASAQDFPTDDVTIVVPFTAGGSNDTMGRLLADGLAKRWGVSVVVENKPGAGSAIGSAHVAQSDPDGYTLLVVSGTFTTNAAVQTNLPFDPAKDIKPVAMIAQAPMVVTVAKDLGVDTVEELIEAAKSKKLFYATTGVGSSTQFAAELFNQRAGIKLHPAHYKGGTNALVDLIGGRVHMYVGTIVQVTPAVSANEILALAQTGTKRADSMPDVPTVAETGVEGAEVQNWWGVFAPGGTPDEIVAKINADVNDVLQTPEAKEFLAKLGASVTPMDATEFASHVTSELEKWKEIAQANDIKAE